jgi:transcriptional regulator with XRE-family HTH domain
MTDFNEYVAEKLKDSEFRAEYDALEPEFAIIHAMIDARKNTGLTQVQLAEKTGIDQSDISRIENGEANPSLKTLKRLASAMDMRLKVEFLPLERQKMRKTEKDHIEAMEGVLSYTEGKIGLPTSRLSVFPVRESYSADEIKDIHKDST